MKLRELLHLIENSDADLLGAQVFVTSGSGDVIYETLSAEIDADGDLVITPDLNRTA